MLSFFKVIFLKKVSKIYKPNIKALYNVSLSIENGEFVSIVGQSGSGKTTLLKLITAEIKPTKGKVIVDKWEVPLIKKKYLPYFRRNIGVVFQDFKLLEKKTAYENIAFAMEVSGCAEQDIEECVPQMLDIVGLKDKANRFPYELSGGEQQRIAISRAMIHEPKILIADEPTGNLDTLNSWDIVQLLLEINKLGTTVILATHGKDFVNSIKKRVITLENGQVIKDQEKGKYIL